MVAVALTPFLLGLAPFFGGFTALLTVELRKLPIALGGFLATAIAASIGSGAGGFARALITMRSLTPFGATPSDLRFTGRPACSRLQ